MAARNPKETRLDADTTKPSTTAPGDGPADTTDPRETAHTVVPQPGPEAIAVGTVNAVKPGEPVDVSADEPASGKGRIERYPATRPDGTQVTVEHNIDTGETKLV